MVGDLISRMLAGALAATGERRSVFAFIGSAYGIRLDRAASAFTLASRRLLFDRGASGVQAQRGAVATCNRHRVQ